jgi:RNA polymerase-interacting CarD/CdnL/TRCF family regulator
MSGAIASMVRTCLNHSDVARIQWQGAAQKYRERWAQGDIDAIAPVLSDLLAWLRRSGIDPTLNAEVRALFNDPIFAKITRRIPSGDAHSKLLEMFRQLAGTREN